MSDFSKWYTSWKMPEKLEDDLDLVLAQVAKAAFEAGVRHAELKALAESDPFTENALQSEAGKRLLERGTQLLKRREIPKSTGIEVCYGDVSILDGWYLCNCCALRSEEPPEPEEHEFVEDLPRTCAHPLESLYADAGKRRCHDCDMAKDPL